VVDSALLAAKIAAVRDATARVRAVLPASLEVFIADRTAREVVTLNIFVAIQDCLDLAAHWLADAGWDMPGAYADVFTALARHDVITHELATVSLPPRRSATLSHNSTAPSTGVVCMPWPPSTSATSTPSARSSPTESETISDRSPRIRRGHADPFQHGMEKLARLLGIAIGEQFHRALQVGEEHRDLLALAFERCLGSENLLSEVLGRVDPRRLELPGHRRAGAQRLRAAAAELIAGVIGEPARGADDRERCRALRAEATAFAVLRVTPGQSIWMLAQEYVRARGKVNAGRASYLVISW
jgi:hypothetical protein